MNNNPKKRSPWVKKIIIIVIALIIVGLVAYAFLAPKPGPEYITAKAEKTDVTQTVSLTGTAEAQKSYQLQFLQPGRVKDIFVQAGSRVKAEEPLASIENQDLSIQLASQKAGLRIAQANLAKAYLEPRKEETRLNNLQIELAEANLEAAKNARENFDALSTNAINKAYLALRQAQQNLDHANEQLRDAEDAAINNQQNVASAGYTVDQAYENYYLAEESYNQVPDELDRQKIELDAAISRAEIALKTSRAQKNLSISKPREEEIAPVKAQMDQAWEAVHLAEYQLNQTILKAPADGIITAVKIERGEIASSALPAITLNSELLRIKALVSEADIAKMKEGQEVSMNFDAFGVDKEFSGIVAEIYPAAEVVQGVVYYVVYVDFAAGAAANAAGPAGAAGNEAVKAGMTANMTVNTSRKNQTLSVPARALQYEGAQAYVEVLRRDQKDPNRITEVEKRNVVTGLQGDEYIEIIYGLNEGEEVVTFTKEAP